MKRIFIIILSATSLLTLANDDRYMQHMLKNIEAIYKAETIEDLQASVNAFDRIANAEKSKWEPLYYTAYGYVMMSTREKDATKKDAYLDMALTTLEKADSLSPNNTELAALRGFVHMMRVTVDPGSRGQKYSMMAMQTFQKAVQLDQKNPRALSLLAQMQFGTAQFFNQQPTEACATAQQALALFQSNVAPANPLAPAWGKGMTQAMVDNCASVDK